MPGEKEKSSPTKKKKKGANVKVPEATTRKGKKPPTFPEHTVDEMRGAEHFIKGQEKPSECKRRQAQTRPLSTMSGWGGRCKGGGGAKGSTGERKNRGYGERPGGVYCRATEKKLSPNRGTKGLKKMV